MEFGLRIGLHGIRKPSGGRVWPAKMPSGGKVRRVGGLRARAHRTGKRGDGRGGGPGSLSVERFEGSPAFGRSAQRVGMLKDGRVHGPGSPRVKRFGGGATFGSRFPTSRDARRRNGPPDRVAFEPPVRLDGGLRVAGSTDGTPETDRFRRRQEGSSEHAARTPRPGTWRLHLF
jgi:hypothetical protein